MAAAALAGAATADGAAARPQARLHGPRRTLDRGAGRRDRPAGGALGSGARLMRAGGRRSGLRGSGAEARRPRRLDPLVPVSSTRLTIPTDYSVSIRAADR